jgi:hypothetical protein
VSSCELRRLRTLTENYRYKPFKAINYSIEDTPIEILEGKPELVHVQLSDTAVKKLDKAAKKYNLGYATMIERAIDYRYRKSIFKYATRLAGEINELEQADKQPFHDSIGFQVLELLVQLSPFHSRAFRGKWLIEAGKAEAGMVM